jgi:hypothetical protein
LAHLRRSANGSNERIPAQQKSILLFPFYG